MPITILYKRRISEDDFGNIIIVVEIINTNGIYIIRKIVTTAFSVTRIWQVSVECTGISLLYNRHIRNCTVWKYMICL